MTYQEFKNKYTGKYIDYDGSYGNQCWDLGQKYVTECLKVPATVLSGCGLVSNMLKDPKRKDLLKYFDEVPVTAMYPGDIVIWEYGHIAIFDHWDGKQNWYFSQNPNAPKVITINRAGGHAFRLKSANKPKKRSREEVVKELQRALNTDYKCGLVIDGSFGSKTESASHNNYLYLGKKGATNHIKWLQTRLIELGYSCGTCGVDGSFGYDTQNAVKKFQNEHGLQVDGCVGKATHRELIR